MIRSSIFEVDCGEVLSGRRLYATGLRVDGTSDDVVHADYSGHVDGKPVHPMVSLTYRIEPALPHLASTGRDIDAEIRVEPPADPTWWPPIHSPGGEREDRPGMATTAGAFGPFVCPAETRQISVSLREIGISARLRSASDDGPDRALGVLVVDLPSSGARWTPAV
ncbi:hypothetical protein [Nocardioides pantholopis]|uniref:hypothetical protein n=1 Tax=Nocardioides pantholopis TaxID=2483798 RepID=UPI000FD6F099|nr:hypothetical protein [Nocardioides pantholopis]